MANYSYSTPYTGQQVATLPPGYMEAATAPGRNLAMGIASMGQNIGKAIEQYRTKKAETETADQTRDTLAGMVQQQLSADPKYLAIQQYMDTGALPEGVTEQDIPRYTQKVMADREMLNKFSGVLGDKFLDMSLAKKKAALGDAAMVLTQYRNDQSNEVRDAAARQALKIGKYQLEGIESKLKQEEILRGAIQYGSNQPTTTTQTEQVTTEVPGAPMPPMPGENVPSVQGQPTFNEQGYIEALRRYRETTTPEVNIADIKAQLAQLAPQLSETPGTIQIPSLGGGLGGGMAVGRATISETPQQIAGRIAQVLPKVRQLESQLELAQKQPLEMPRREQFLTQVEAQPSAMPAPLSAPLTVTRNVSTQVPISYEDQSKRLTQYLLQQGAKPETLAMVPQILSMVGQRMPTRVEPVGNIGSVVRFGDKEQFVPALKADIGDMLKVKGLTIDFPEFRGTAPTEAEAAKFRDQYSSVLESRRAISDLLDIAKMGTAMQQTPEIRTKANSLVSGLRGVERINIIGPGTITPEDFKLLNSVIPDPTAIFSLKKSNIQAFETMLQKSARAIESKAKGIGLEMIKPQAQPVTGASSGNFRLVPGKGIQPIQ